MNSGGVNFRIERLTDSNFHVGKQKIELVLAFKEVSFYTLSSARRPTPNDDDAGKWFREDAKARAVIRLSLSEKHLEHVRDCASTATM